MVMTELSSTQWLNSIWLSLQRGEDTALLTMSRLEDLLSQNQQLLQALNDFQTAIMHQPAPIIEIPQLPAPKVLSKKEPDPNISYLAELFVKSQSASQIVLDQIKEIIKSQIAAEKQPTRIMAGGPRSVKIENQLIPEAYDEMVMTYVGTNIDTVTYMQNNRAIATLSMTYSGDNLIRVRRS